MVAAEDKVCAFGRHYCIKVKQASNCWSVRLTEIRPKRKVVDLALFANTFNVNALNAHQESAGRQRT